MRQSSPSFPKAATLDGVPRQPTDEEIVSRIKGLADGAQRRDLLGELFSRHYQRVTAWALRFSRSEDAAADLAQEVFVAAQRGIEGFRAESRFSTWLYTITRRLAINRTVALSRVAFVDLEGPAATLADPGPSPAEQVDHRVLTERLNRLIDSELDEQEARVLILHFRHGMTLPQITEILGLTNRSGAKAQLVAAKRKLRRAATKIDGLRQLAVAAGEGGES